MKLLALLLGAILLNSIAGHADSQESRHNPGHTTTENTQQARDFMNSYLSVYNRRFGQPQRADVFEAELAALVHQPVLVSPPVGQPRVPSSAEAFTAGFEGFVQGLEKKGVVKLQWADVQIRELSPEKVLVNNTGHGVNAAGDVVYETVSLYLLSLIDGRWQITLFSPYLTGNTFNI